MGKTCRKPGRVPALHISRGLGKFIVLCTQIIEFSLKNRMIICNYRMIL